MPLRVMIMLVILAGIPSNVFPETLDALTIQRSAAFRLTDLISLSDGWNQWSINGFRIRTAPDGYSYDDGQSWSLMLNGHRIAPGVFGQRNINLLPYTVSQMKSLAFSDGAGEHPCMSLKTKTPKQGIALRCRWGTSNETGDPGPFRYTSDRYNTDTSNVDRIGPDTAVFLEGATEHWTFRTGVNSIIHASTDNALMKGASFTSWEHRQFRSIIPSIDIGTTALPGEHHFSAFGSFSGDITDIFSMPPEKRYRTDLLFVEPLGDAFPVETTFAHAGQNGYVPLRDGSSIRYRIDSTYGRSRMGRNIDIPDAVEAEITDTNGALSHETDTHSIGATIGRRTTDTVSSRTTDTIVTVHGSHTVSGRKSSRTAHLAIAHDMTYTAIRTGVTNRRKLDARTDLTASLSYRERLATEERPTSYRAREYAPLLDALGIALDTGNAPAVNRTIKSGLSLKRTLAASVTITGTATYRYIETGEITTFTSTPTGNGRLFDSSIRVGNVHNSHIAGASLAINHAPSKRLRQQLTVRTSGCIEEGNKAFGDMYERTPSYAGYYRLEYEPVRGFSVFWRVRHEAGGSFHGWENRDGSSFINTTDERTTVDLALRKTFLHNSMRCSVLAANIFNDDTRNHPLGARFGRALAVNVEWYAGSRSARDRQELSPRHLSR